MIMALLLFHRHQHGCCSTATSTPGKPIHMAGRGMPGGIVISP
jgi:hypothetical protein